MRPALNPRYTFAHFVIGQSNDLAAASASAVAAAPGKAYNPLFIYGGTGLGKTHLMQAVAHEVLLSRRAARLVCVAAEQFTNELVAAVQERSLEAFRERYRSADLLLVDDVHVLANRESAQEEFAETFQALADAGRQVMLTSDRPPEELGVEERLVRRFRRGRVADISLPDFEHRLAILRHRIAAEGHEPLLAPDVPEFVATHVRANVRELEGALTRLVALATMRGRAAGVEDARALLRVHADAPPAPDDGRARIEALQRLVAAEWGVTPEALVAKRRTRPLVEARQVAMWLCRETLRLPLAEIGRLFGGRDHSTVIHGLERVRQGLDEDARFRERVQRLARRAGELAGGTAR